MEKQNNFSKEVTKIIKVIRKQYQAKQVDICEVVGISQSKLSKIESGKLRLSLEGFTKLCLTYQIPLDTHLLGYIDNMSFINFDNWRKRPNSFKIPMKYQSFPSITTREIKPVLEFSKKTYGEEYLHKKLKEEDVDPLYFYKMDNLINPLFLVEFTQKVLDEKKVTLEDVFKESSFSSKSIHGGALESLTSGKGADSSITQVLKKYSKLSGLYDCNFTRKVEAKSKNEVKLTMTPTDGFLSFTEDWDNSKKKLLSDYYYEFTKGICQLGKEKNFELLHESNRENECTFLISS